MDEVTRERRLMAAPERPCDHVQPDYGSLHQELRRKGMTLMLLWEEHRANHADRKTHGYTGLCENYRRFGPCQYCHVHDILKNNRDQSAPATAHVRGQGYYQRGTTR